MFDRRDTASATLDTATHLSPQQLAALASGAHTTPQQDRHLAICRECFTLCAELIRCREEAELRGVEAPPEVLRLGQVTVDRLVDARRRVEPVVEELPAKSTRHRRSRLLTPGLAVAVLLAFLVVWSPWSSSLPGAEVLDPVREALVLQSASGLVNPLVAEADLDAVPALRGSGSQPLNAAGSSLRESIGELLRAYQQSPDSVELASWLVSALQADGQLRSARGYLEIALQRHPRDRRLKMLEVLQYNGEGEFARAEAALERLVEQDSRDELARRNLARLRAARG